MPHQPPEMLDDYACMLVPGRPLIDVRAPEEFSKGSLPTAVNLPILDDEERRQVGLCYRRRGQAAAIALGHDLVSGSNRESKIEAWTRFARKNKNSALYCWRGGMRSSIAQSWLHEAGIAIPRVAGGFKALRSHLIAATDRLASRSEIVLIGGRTGTGKTDFIAPLDNAIDLEGLANHRGSAFGNRCVPQPAQIDFEHSVAIQWLMIEKSGHNKVFMEDEGKFIGRCRLPLSLSNTFATAPLIILESQLADRVARINRDYVTGLLDEMSEHQSKFSQQPHIESPFERFARSLLESLSRIRKRLGLKRYGEIRTLMETALAVHGSANQVSAHDAWIEALLTQYYDPMYDYQIKQRSEHIIHQGNEAEVRSFLAGPR